MKNRKSPDLRANQPKPKTNNQNSSTVPAMIIGGAILGNLIVPGVGGAIIGGVVGGIFGSKSDSSPHNNKKK